LFDTETIPQLSPLVCFMLVQGALQRNDQRRQILPNDFPDDIEVDVEVRVNQAVSHSDDLKLENVRGRVLPFF
jgi:hypothetical protein